MHKPRTANIKMVPESVVGLFLLTCLTSISAFAADPAPDGVAFFEERIRPVLIDHCYKCHGSDPDKIKSDLNLTHRDGLLNHESGPVLTPGDPQASPILTALRYQDPDLQMPPTGKLSDEIVRDFETWISMGAPDPRDTPLDPAALVAETSWEATLERRKNWWSFQPIASPEPPQVSDPQWQSNPVDAFIARKHAEQDLTPSPLADPHTLIRRLSFVLTGLPPTKEEVDSFVVQANSDQQAAVAAATDRLLASPRFGERWARHWMDWVRYAESHGSEGDPAIPYASRYRDYLIRALNADVPYNDLLREHIAGDILPDPRINEELGIKESSIGTAQYRFVLHGFGPTDALLEQVRFTNDQIDAISKAFLATTVSCARCHDHKFDPVSQKDFYALYGIMASCRPATIIIDTLQRQNLNKEKLAAKKKEIQEALAEIWNIEIDSLEERLTNPPETLAKSIGNATTTFDPLHPWQRLHNATGSAFERGWREIHSQWRASEDALRKRSEVKHPLSWDLAKPTDWRTHGNGVDSGPSPAGAFAIHHEGDRALIGIYPAGIYSHDLSTKHSGTIASPRFKLDNYDLYLRIAGNGHAVARYVIQNYPRNGTVYPYHSLTSNDWRWQRWDMAYWNGDMAHIELSTAMDQPVLVQTGNSRSWFGITDAILVTKGQPAPQELATEFTRPFYAIDGEMKSVANLVKRYQDSLRTSVDAWRSGEATNDQAHYLNKAIHSGLLSNSKSASEVLDTHIQAYRALEAEIPVPTRVPGVLEHVPFNQAFLPRGDHKNPGDLVPRGFIEALDATPYQTDDAGRLALANSLVADANPLTARVITNRLWHHVFGTGIVATPDDFGVMGAAPTHPELLDYLANQMRTEGWSIKQTLRTLVTSRTFQLSSKPTDRATQHDPANQFLTHGNMRRLEAEAIRDALLVAAGRMNLTPPDGSVDGNSDRRSVYVRVIRNNLDPFLTTFDAPAPVSAKGRRDATNVPAHALTLMNDPFVRDAAEKLAARIRDDSTLADDTARITRLFEVVTNRPPTDSERTMLANYLAASKNRPPGIDHDPSLKPTIDQLNERIAAIHIEMEERRVAALAKDDNLARLPERDQNKKISAALVNEVSDLETRLANANALAAPPKPWVELAHSLFNTKEFIYLK